MLRTFTPMSHVTYIRHCTHEPCYVHKAMHPWAMLCTFTPMSHVTYIHTHEPCYVHSHPWAMLHTFTPMSHVIYIRTHEPCYIHSHPWAMLHTFTPMSHVLTLLNYNPLTQEASHPLPKHSSPTLLFPTPQSPAIVHVAHLPGCWLCVCMATEMNDCRYWGSYYDRNPKTISPVCVCHRIQVSSFYGYVNV